MSYGILYEEAFKPKLERGLSKSAEASVTAEGVAPPKKVPWLEIILAGGVVMAVTVTAITIATRKR